MDDMQIIELYWNREELAITESEHAYGDYCRTIAWNILRDRQDTEECVNDTWLKAWNAMPPQRPTVLSAFLGSITRNLSLDRYRSSHAKKRGRGQLEAVFEELDTCIPSDAAAEQRVHLQELTDLLNGFLRSLSQRDRCVFIRRYWYTDPILDIARRYAMTEVGVKVNLHRSRKKLRSLLEQEGYTV